MPTNIATGNSAEFIVRFHTSSDGLVTPSSAYIALTYNVAKVPTTANLSLSLSGSFFIGTWSTVGVDAPSDVGWSAISNSSAIPAVAKTGQIRITT